MRPGVTIALTAVDRRRLGAIVGNRSGAGGIHRHAHDEFRIVAYRGDCKVWSVLA
jgi:hypothetical protein